MVRRIIVAHCTAGRQDATPTLEAMSTAMFTAMRNMRLNPAVPDVFLTPSDITGGGWRSIAEVAEIGMLALTLQPHVKCSAPATARKRNLLRNVVHQVCTWYFASCHRTYAAEDVAALAARTTALRATLRAAEAEFDVVFGCPKVHRLRHVSELVTFFCTALTTA